MDAEGADPKGFRAAPEDEPSRSSRYKWAKRLTLGGLAVFLVSMVALVATLAMSSGGARYGAPPVATPSPTYMSTEEPEPMPTTIGGDVLAGETAEEYRWRMSSEENLTEALARVDYLLTSDFTGAEWFEEELLYIRENLISAEESRTFANQARQQDDQQQQSTAAATPTEVAAPTPEVLVERPEGQGAVVFVSVAGAIAGLLGAIAGVFTALATWLKAKRHPAAESD